MTQRTTTDGPTELEIVNELMKRRRWCTTGRHFETARKFYQNRYGKWKSSCNPCLAKTAKEKRCQQKLGVGRGVAPAEEVQSVVTQATTTKTVAPKKWTSWANKTEALPDAEPLSSSRALAITPGLPIIAGGTLTTKGLQLDDDLTVDRARTIAAQIASIGRLVPWVWGDLLVLAHVKWGDQLPEWSKESDLSPKTLLNYRTLAKAFPFSRRREKLSIGHHAAVAGLPVADADRLLMEAEASGMRLTKLRANVASLRKPDDDIADDERKDDDKSSDDEPDDEITDKDDDKGDDETNNDDERNDIGDQVNLNVRLTENIWTTVTAVLMKQTDIAVKSLQEPTSDQVASLCQTACNLDPRSASNFDPSRSRARQSLRPVFAEVSVAHRAAGDGCVCEC